MTVTDQNETQGMESEMEGAQEYAQEGEIEAEGAGAHESEGAPEVDQIPEYKRMKHKIKANGKEFEVDYEDLVSGYSKATAADQRFKEAAEMKKAADQVVSQVKMLQNDPSKLLQLVGEERFTELAEQFLYKKYSKAEMSPEQRELEELREYRNAQERARQEAEQKENATKQERQVEEYRQSFQKKFDTILDGMGWPKTPETIARIARYYQSATEQGVEPTDKDVQKYLEKNYSSELKGLFSNVSVDKLYEMIGNDGLKALRNYDLQKVRNPKSQNAQGSNQQSTPRGKSRSLDEALAEAWKRSGL